jgi:hypothetical protein
MAFFGSIVRLGFVGVLVLATVSCSSDLQFPLIEKQKSAPKNMLESFSNVSAAAQACEKATCITIQKAAFGKIFLLMSSGITLGSAPQWYDMKPLVVSFKKNNTDVALVAENFTSIYQEIQGNMLVQSFKIVAEDETSVTFDWGKGLRSIVAQTPYDVDAPRAAKDLTEPSVTSIPVTDSFVENVKVTEGNIELTQLSKIITPAAQIDKSLKVNFSSTEETLTMNIQIRAYNLGPDFKKKEYDKTRRVGFFVTKISKPGLSQDITNLITKWDLSPAKGPITVRISNAVPADYVQSVVEAVQYWNKVFGRDVLVAKPGVDPMAGPEDRSIMIRWLPWMDAGAAYAMGQSDPLTGEVLRAQVFMPAAFTKVGSADLVKLNDRSPVAAINGAIACDFTQSLQKMQALAREKSDSQRLRLAQDSVRATVAHELGHALGLRHNFAGSYSAKVSTAQIFESVKTYFKDLNHQGLETSTSIMDYVSGVDDILMAAHIKYQPLSYDKMAMDWAYSDDDKVLDEKVSKYCTDDDIGLANSQGLNIYGCERFDAGNNPLLRKYLDAKDEKNNMVYVVFASIIGRMYPGDQPGVVKDLDQVLEDTKKWGVADLQALGFVSSVLVDRFVGGAPSGAFASLESVKTGQVLYSKFGVDVPLAKQRWAHLQEAGGFATMLNGIATNGDGKYDYDWYQKQVEELKASPFLAKGTTLSGREYELSADQQKKLLAFYAAFAKGNAAALTKGLLNLVPLQNSVVKDDEGNEQKVSTVYAANVMTENDATGVAQFVSTLYLDNETEQTVKVGEGQVKEVKVPVRRMSADDRVKFAPLLSSVSMRVPMAPIKTGIRAQIFEGVAALVKEADATVPDPRTMTSEDLAKLPAALTQKGLLDLNAAGWLVGELKLVLALDKVQ